MINNLTKNENKIVEFFSQKPDEIHVRGLADKIDMPYSSVRKALSSLEEKDLLESNELSKMTFYSPTDENFRDLKKIINLTNLEESGLIDYLEKEFKPRSIVLFGSYLEGRDKEGSDIDLAVIGGREKNPDLLDFEQKLHREIQITQVENPKEENKDFRNTLANGFVVLGYLEVV